MAGTDAGNSGDVAEITDPLDPLISAVGKGNDATARLDEHLRLIGAEIIQLDGGSSYNQARYTQLRVRYLILNRATAGDSILSVGTTQYAFTLPAEPVVIPFPIILARGADLALTGDGRIYIVGDPE